MRRLLNQLWFLFVLPMTLGVVLFLAANTETGRGLIVRGIEQASGGQVKLSGLGGVLPLAPRLAHLELRDADGTWLEIDDAALAVDGGQLLRGTLAIDTLSARTLVLRRLPVSQGAAAEPLQLPLPVQLRSLAIAALNLDAVLPGAPMLTVAGSGSLRGVQDGEASLLLGTPDPDDGYHLDIARLHGNYRLALAIAEAPGGLLVGFASKAGLQLPTQLGAWRADVTAEGPQQALSFNATLDAEPLRVSAEGVLDLGGAAEGRLQLDATGELALTEAPGPIPALLGATAPFSLSVHRAGDVWRVASARIDGAGLKASVQGGAGRDAVDLTWTLDLSDLGLLAAGWSGQAQANGLAIGRPGAPDLSADLEIAAGLTGRGSGRLRGRLSARPAEPVGSLDLTGDWAGQPVAIALKAGRSVSGDLNLLLRDSRWASATASGSLRLRSGASLPQGEVRLRIENLTDLGPLLSLTAVAPSVTDLAGRLSARVSLTEQGVALIEAAGNGLTLPGAIQIETLLLDAQMTEPLGAAATNATLRVGGLLVGAITGDLSLTARGTAAALSLAVDRLRLGLGQQQGMMDITGRLTPVLDLDVSVAGLSLGLARQMGTELPLTGKLDAQARLTGAPTAPIGTIRLQGRGLRLTEGTGRGIPPVELDASANLSASATELDATAETGTGTRLRLLGRISGRPFKPGTLALRADGRVDLALLDPLLAGGGRQVSGQAILATAITGTFAAPRLDGSLRLSQAALHDRTLGLALTDIDGTLALAGDTLRVEQFSGRAGAGSVALSGSVGLLVPGLPPGLPVDLRLVARNARPIQSDQLEIKGDADLRLLGSATERPTLSGKLLFSRVDIRLPERLPAGIVSLQVRERGQRRSGNPASTSSAAVWQPELGLDLLVSAPRAVQVQGRGVDAELGGDLRVRGTLADPAIDGGLDLVRGQYQLVGQTLRFTSGRLGFDGAAGLDPTLDLEARVTVAGSTAILSVLGTAGAPRIALRGEPEMPQDEVLSRLLFGVAGGRLSPLQATRLGLAAASISGIGDVGGLGVLERARTGLRLDRLSIGTDERGDASLEGGRNITERIYLGARQGVRTGEPQGVARIEVTPRIRLEADVGVTGGTRAGAAYEREY